MKALGIFEGKKEWEIRVHGRLYKERMKKRIELKFSIGEDHAPPICNVSISISQKKRKMM